MARVVLVTGGSRGIGAATARLAAAEGWRVVLSYRTERDAAEAVVSDIVKAGGAAEAVAVDISVEREVIDLFEHCRARHGRIDGLVNNAGILPPVGTFTEIDLDRWERTLRINATGTFLCCREAAKQMMQAGEGPGKQPGGAIVNLSSMAAPLGGAGEFVDYAASKGAVESLTIGLAKELGPKGIRVNAVRPGLIDTEIHGSAGDAGRVARLAGTVPMARAGTSEETAAAAVWLLSDAASYVTGAIIPVSGGR